MGSPIPPCECSMKWKCWLGKLLLGVTQKLQTSVYQRLLRTGKECGVRTLVRALSLLLQGITSDMKPGGGMLSSTAE